MSSILKVWKTIVLILQLPCSRDLTEMTHFSVTLTSLARILLFRETILASDSFDSGTKSDLQATGTDLGNNEGKTKLKHEIF